MRVMNWNIEWMNNWYVGGNQVAFRNAHPATGITDVDELARRVAGVIQTLDPDVLTIQEGPSDVREMLLFTDTYLVGANGDPIFDVFGGVDGGSQKIYTLVKRGGELLNARAPDEGITADFEDSWESDVDGDMRIEAYNFTRLPVVVRGDLSDGTEVRVASLHTKSKYVQDGEAMWNDPARRDQFVFAALKNRRRISSEAMRVRRYLDERLQAQNDSKVVVTGDFNDGPGIDYFERRYLTHNVTDILLGSTYRPDLLFDHAFLQRIPEERRYTVIFDDFVDGIENRHILLDHILVSPVLASAVNGDVAHEAYNAATNTNAQRRQRYPSDHRPVIADF